MSVLLLCKGSDLIPKYKFTQEELEQMSQNRWLTLRERQVFEMFYRDGTAIEDIAAEFDVNRCTISRDLASIRKKTIKKLK